MANEITLRLHTKEVIKSINDAAARRMLEATNEVRNVVLKTLSGKRSGKRYRVPGTQRMYTASAPGQPPASRLGELRQSIRTTLETEGKTLKGTIGTNLVQGKHLEFGTRFMTPRTWLRPSFEKAIPRLKQILGGRWVP